MNHTIVSRLAARTGLSLAEIREFKWPHRPQTSCLTCLLGHDRYGYCLGAAQGDPWWSADGQTSGVFIESIVKLVPPGAYWSVCFRSVDPVVDLDIVLPLSWHGPVLEEVDLELDVLRMMDGSVHVRDEEEFERIRAIWPMPPDLVSRAYETCAWARAQVESGTEPFSRVGFTWLERFESEVTR